MTDHFAEFSFPTEKQSFCHFYFSTGRRSFSGDHFRHCVSADRSFADTFNTQLDRFCYFRKNSSTPELAPPNRVNSSAVLQTPTQTAEQHASKTAVEHAFLSNSSEQFRFCLSALSSNTAPRVHSKTLVWDQHG